MYLRSFFTKFFPPGIRQRGESIHALGQVTLLVGNQWKVSARVQGSNRYRVEMFREADEIHVHCECPYFESEGGCKHIWAALLAADEKHYLQGKPGSGPPELVEDWDDVLEPDLFEDAWQSPRVTSPTRPAFKKPEPPPDPWRDLLNRATQPSRAFRGDESWPAGREIQYVLDAARIGSEGLHLELVLRDRKQDGQWGKPKRLRIPRAALSRVQDQGDRELLLLLGGAPDPYGYNPDSIPFGYELRDALPALLLPRMCSTGRCRLRKDVTAPFETWIPLAWDPGAAWQFRLHVEREGIHWMVRGYLERGEERMDLRQPDLLIEEGLVFDRGLVAPLDHNGAFGWIQLLRKEGQVAVPLQQGSELVSAMLRHPRLPRIDWPDELRYEEVTPAPRPALKIEEPKQYSWQKKDWLRGQLSFDYGGTRVHFEDPSQGVYEPGRRRLIRRDPAAEQSAIQQLQATGCKRAEPIYGESGPRWELKAGRLPNVVRELVRAGWHIEAEGKTFRRPGNFRLEISSGIDWFELHGAVEYGSSEVKLPELLKAIHSGKHLVRLGDGSYGVLPEELLEQYGLLVRLGQAHEDHLRFSRTQTGLLDVLLAERPEIQVDQVFARARDELRQFAGIQPATQPDGFCGTLRGYQLEGLAWMHFLQRFGFGGCLADDMGVGKTPQVLALLETRRSLRAEAGPSLVVVPRSLIYNWIQEAARFTPQVRVLDHTGAGRAKNAGRFDDYDVILTTYGTLRRDAVEFQNVRFDYIVLDEAQAIKNATSESAKATRLLQGNHRLALSGTPVENHLGELWSLLEFLNPGMLGAASVFQLAGGALRNPDEETRRLLARAVRPFILRRTKDQVARELPPKLEQTLYCELEPPQRKLYDELREHYRQALLSRIEVEGIAKSKIQILEALLRLRQAACHPGLIDKQRSGEPSAKLDLLVPQLAQVIEEGHKALVFSQFTSLLDILRRQLDHDQVVYEYLDGRTRDRQTCVERFQNDPDCPLFLVSLKAGGVGLNLTAAEYVYLLDPWWNPAVEAQAIDRAHRIGQTRHVFAYRLIARETVEEKVLELQKSKRDLADAIINQDNRVLSSLGREDLELLLS